MEIIFWEIFQLQGQKCCRKVWRRQIVSSAGASHHERRMLQEKTEEHGSAEKPHYGVQFER